MLTAMTVSAVPSADAGYDRIPRPGAPLTHVPEPTRDPTAESPRRLELDTVAAHWQVALDSAQRALAAAGPSVRPGELEGVRRQLMQERDETARALVRLARAIGAPSPWLSPTPVSPAMLGLPSTAQACLFDLDGVLTDSDALHARAWSEVFDDLLLRLAERTGWQFVPFDRDADYRTYLDGRARLEGVHAFLASRGIRLPEGRPEDTAHIDSAQGLARHKSAALERLLHEHGVTALEGVRRYLVAAGHAGVKRAVVSASASTREILEVAALAPLVDAYVDADTMRRERLRSLPAPDVLACICRLLAVEPEDAVLLTHNPAGAAAGKAAGLTVVGVGDGAGSDLLHGFGASTVVPSLSVLLDRRLRNVAS
jgi:beta-phosphoglucomutase-like phosphatase (HAD superfamily)